jgi:atypical dual specificity phosphatase
MRDLRVLAKNHIGALLRLAEEHECSVTVEDLKKAGIRDCWIPVPDGGAPKTGQIVQAVSFVMNERSAGRRVALSCGAGYGRTGTLLACYLVACGEEPRQAIVKAGTIEYECQREAVLQYAAQLHC